MSDFDYSSLDPELQKKIEGWQKNSPANKQLQTLEDLTAITQEIFGILEDNTEAGEKTTKELGATLMDIRDKLTSLNDKKAPEMPDHAKPVVGAIDDLKAALTASIKGIELRPEIKVGSPDVNVPDVDLSELEKVVKTELPKAFKEAVKLIPKTEIPKNDYSELADLLSAQISWLESIDTASRMKVQIPSTLKVTNPDGTPIAGGSGGTTYSRPTNSYNLVQFDDSSSASYEYYAYMDKDGNWYVKRLTVATGLMEYTAPVGTSYATGWTNRASLTYVDYGTAF